MDNVIMRKNKEEPIYTEADMIILAEKLAETHKKLAKCNAFINSIPAPTRECIVGIPIFYQIVQEEFGIILPYKMHSDFLSYYNGKLTPDKNEKIKNIIKKLQELQETIHEGNYV